METKNVLDVLDLEYFSEIDKYAIKMSIIATFISILISNLTYYLFFYCENYPDCSECIFSFRIFWIGNLFILLLTNFLIFTWNILNIDFEKEIGLFIISALLGSIMQQFIFMGNFLNSAHKIGFIFSYLIFILIIFTSINLFLDFLKLNKIIKINCENLNVFGFILKFSMIFSLIISFINFMNNYHEKKIYTIIFLIEEYFFIFIGIPLYLLLNIYNKLRFSLKPRFNSVEYHSLFQLFNIINIIVRIIYMRENSHIHNIDNNFSRSIFLGKNYVLLIQIPTLILYIT